MINQTSITQIATQVLKSLLEIGTSWADAVENAATGPSGNAGIAAIKLAYVPPHLRNRPPASELPASSVSGPPSGSDGFANSRPAGGSQWAGSRADYGRHGYGGGSRATGGWGGREREVNPFGKDDVVNTFAEIDLGDALNLNIRRCKYVKPTPVQRHAIPISLAGRDLMACAQTAAFCFPIISGIMRGHIPNRPHGVRTVHPLALILSPTRELSMQ
ncbi:hypothetical protein C2S51_038693, partial [Perilla frutescens var. frutescens]